MTNFDKLHNSNIDELADWIDKYGQFDSSQWMLWFGRQYCDKCEPIMCHYEETSEHEFPCSWCELNDNKCKFFPDMDETPDNREIIKMWLEEGGMTYGARQWFSKQKH